MPKRNLEFTPDGGLSRIPEARAEHLNGVIRRTAEAGGTVGDVIRALDNEDCTDTEWLVFIYGLGYKHGRKTGHDDAIAEVNAEADSVAQRVADAVKAGLQGQIPGAGEISGIQISVKSGSEIVGNYEEKPDGDREFGTEPLRAQGGTCTCPRCTARRAAQAAKPEIIN